MNSHLAIDETDMILRKYEPEQLVKNIAKNNGKAIVFGINEIACFLPSVINIAKAVHKAGLRVGCLTNGFEMEYSAELLAEM